MYVSVMCLNQIRAFAKLKLTMQISHPKIVLKKSLDISWRHLNWEGCILPSNPLID